MWRLPVHAHGGWFLSRGLLMCLGWVLLVLLVVLVVYLISGRTKRASPAPPSAAATPRLPKPSEDALEIARLRYARGDISRDEYLQMKADLQPPEQG